MATASISTIGRAVRGHLLEGKMTWEKMTRPAGEKFTRDNQVGYFNRLLRLVGLVKCQLSFNIKMKRKARFSRRTSHEPNQFEFRPNQINLAELIQTPILIPGELNSIGDKIDQRALIRAKLP